jgi:succinyl-diaminopimelate desuccinylase
MEKRELKAWMLNEIDKRMPEFKKLLCDVVRIPTDSPPGNTTKCILFLTEQLKSKGLSVDIYEPKRRNPNIVSILKGKEEGLNLVLNGHIDQFPAGNLEDWSYDPYIGICQDGKILGRGVADMKAGSVISLICFQLIHELSIPIKGQLTLTIVSDEENGGKWGSQWLLENVSLTRGNSVLNGEPSGSDQIIIGHKGTHWLKVTVIDSASHGSLPAEENTITKALRIVKALEKLQGWKKETPKDLDDIIKVAKEYLEKKPYGKGKSWALDSTTVNFSLIKGGTRVNVTPRECEVTIDIRAPIGITTADLHFKVDEILQKSGLKSNEISYKWIFDGAASYSSPMADIVQLVKVNAEQIVGTEPLISTWYANSDCRLWAYRNIPYTVYGPTPYNMASPDEYILEKEFEQILKVHATTVIDYLC